MKKTQPTKRARPLVTRKKPRQERSRNTVEIILRAAAHILVKEGYERASTNRIAQAAGVSIGSLYQYFPSKEALVRALIDDHVAQIQAVLTPDVSVLGKPLPVLARALVEAMMAAHAVNPALHAELMRVGDALGLSPNAPVYRTGIALVKALLAMHASSVRDVDDELSPFIIVCSVESIIHEASKDHPDYLTNPKLVDEVTHLLLRYVLR